MITILQAPGQIVFSRNPVWVKVQSDALYANAGAKCIFFVEFPGGPLIEDQSFGLSIEGRDLVFTVKDAPDDSGFQIRSGDTLTALQWAQQVVEDLHTNFYLHKAFKISVDQTGATPRAKFEAQEFGTKFTPASESVTIALNTVQPGSERVLQPNFRLFLSLFVQDHQGNAFECVMRDLPLVVDQDGKADFNLSSGLSQALLEIGNGFDVPPALPNCQVNTRSCRKFYFEIAEAYGNKQVIRKVITSDTSHVAFGGVSKVIEANFNIQTYFLEAGKIKFLKQEHTTKKVKQFQVEWLSAILLLAPHAVIKQVVKVFYSDNSNTTISPYSFNNLAQYQKITIPAGASQLSLPAINVSKRITKYEVWLADGDDQRISEIRTYVLDYLFIDHTRQYLHLNSLGGYDTKLAIGEGSTQYELDATRASITRSADFNFSQGEVIEFDHKLTQKEKVLTGFMSKRQLLAWRDFFLSPDKYLIKPSGAYPLAVNSKTINELQDGTFLHALEFETSYRYAEALYTEEPEIINEIIDVNQYLPPVAVEVPPNFDHLYWRKDQSLNTVQIQALLDVIRTTEAQRHQDHQEELDALLLALQDKSDSNHTHDERYLQLADYTVDIEEIGTRLILCGKWVEDFVLDPDEEEPSSGYFENAVVWHKKGLWQSTEELNQDEPGLTPTWSLIAGVCSVDIVASGGMNIAWQTDTIPGGTVTFAELFGNVLPEIYGHFTESSVEDTDVSSYYKPNLKITTTAGEISLVELLDVFPGTITLYCIK